MIINFKEMSENTIEKFNGGEGHFCVKMFNDGTNKILQGRLEPGCSVGMHTHNGTSEIIYVLSGQGTMYLGDGGKEILNPGDCHYCPEGTGHSFVNESDADLTFFAVVPVHNK